MEKTEKFECIKSFFTPEKWNILSDYEKKRYLNIKNNYEYLKSAGIPAKLPRFMCSDDKGTSKLPYSKKASCKSDLHKMPGFFSDAYNCGEEENEIDDENMAEKKKISDLLSVTLNYDDEEISENIVTASLKKAKVMSDSSSQSSKSISVASQSMSELSSSDKNSSENLRDMSDSSFATESDNEGGNEENEFDNTKEDRRIYETKSSKVVSDTLNKMKNICNLSPSSFGDDVESDKYLYFASDTDLKAKNKERRKKPELKITINKIRGGEKKLTHLGNSNSPRSTSLENNRNDHESLANEKLMKFKAEFSNLRQASKHSNLSRAESVCYKVMDAFLSMEVPRGRKTIVSICDINRLR